ncbi:MAG TPA: 4-hydroxythreonine-4-phosphate dehydrogenase PdxA [Deltaproteobacteria bacterium]|nr:4-hydroxythreonine-4-phosphate dehydrogenase PdxA [Deltaproteobacteria bacterium]
MKRIGITMGDPLGIGAEIIQKAVPKFRGQARFHVFGDPRLLGELKSEELIPIDAAASGAWTPQEAGRAAVAYLEGAMEAYRSGSIDALVTAPISKHHCRLAAFPYPGHTEYLAAQTGSRRYVMMMAGPRLKVTLATIHEPIAKVAQALSREKILTTLQVTYEGLRERFGLEAPRIAVCGLNPHAGEEGLLGQEEIEIIAPALQVARERGVPCAGPLVPDAVFHEAYEGKWDAVVCMYHDQGLIPFKMIHFRDGVNVTLGLPLIRTSPDHGTAFDIAGRGIADSTSMEAAIRMALEMAS